MPTMKQLRTTMDSGTADGAAAGKALADYYYIYNEEYNAILNTRYSVDSALFSVKNGQGPTGPADSIMLESLLLELDARMKRLDQKMLAFQASELSITPPTAAQVAEVKDLTAEVARIQVKAGTVDRILTALSKLVSLIGGVHGA
jgi:hypothetical protein